MLYLRQSVESPEFVRVRRHFRFLPVLVVVIARGRFRVQAPIAFGVHHGKSQPEETSWHMLSGIVIASYGELENADRAKVPFEQGL